ncbi:MAG: hypothetical protein GY854_24175 [Deltaproteobacteria bacterium]|nr:hypothetical protein [Deltaproteobacteria bacterium]
MGKILIAGITGVFIGALTVEILSRKRPKLTQDVEHRAKKTVKAFVEAYKEGYGTDP